MHQRTTRPNPALDAALAAMLGRPATIAEVLAALEARNTAPPPAPAPGELLTMKEAAARLKVCKRTLWNLARRDELRLVKLGSATRVPAVEVERLAAGLPPDESPAPTPQNGRGGIARSTIAFANASHGGEG